MIDIEYCCPIDRGKLTKNTEEFVCESCLSRFPIVNGIPILINENNSVFRISDYSGNSPYQGASGHGGSADRVTGLRKLYRRFARRLSEAAVPGSESRQPIADILRDNANARILVVGSGERHHGGNILYTDVAFAQGIVCICDAHDLPFFNDSFDAVIAESVLEHVCDPQRCVAEFVRVLKPRGYVSAVTPFLQPVHMGAHDFTRFTYLGHRRLFRQFDDIESGMCGGPGYSAIHLIRTLAVTVTERPSLRAVLRLITLVATYPLRYVDPLLSRHASAYNSACAFFFFGRKREMTIPDRDIIRMFRGQ